MTSPKTLRQAAIRVLETRDAREKAARARSVAQAWQTRTLSEVGPLAPVPVRPGRPDRPELKRPRDVPRRKIGPGVEGRVALLHALAHIELNAIDLAFDIVARFDDPGQDERFYDDWVKVGDDEARHFLLVDDRLRELGACYGDLAAHDGLWQASMETADDLLARLAIVPMVLEARGLDVTPDMIQKLRAVGDDDSADRLQVIYDDEIGHVAAGKRWFERLCAGRDLSPVETWQDLVRCRFKGGIKPPINSTGREKAGFPAAYYQPLL